MIDDEKRPDKTHSIVVALTTMEENQRNGAAGRRSPRPVGAVSAASIAGRTAKQFHTAYHSSLMLSGRGEGCAINRSSISLSTDEPTWPGAAVQVHAISLDSIRRLKVV